jgi:hypothetical protein
VSTSEREKAFNQAMTQVYQRAKKEIGYTATRFAQMLGEHGGLKTARLLLHSNAVSDGFIALWEAKRLDLTVESQILTPEFQPLFTEEELATARQRLIDYGGSSDTVPVKPRSASRPARRATVAQASPKESNDEVLAEISRRRNAIEARLRDVLAQGLRYEYGPKAAAMLIGCLAESRRTALVGKAYKEMWGALYFNELRDVVSKEWAAFSGWFGEDKEKVLNWLEHINRTRADAHAKSLSDDDLAYLRVCFKRLEEALDL